MISGDGDIWSKHVHQFVTMIIVHASQDTSIIYNEIGTNFGKPVNGVIVVSEEII